MPDTLWKRIKAAAKSAKQPISTWVRESLHRAASQEPTQ